MLADLAQTGAIRAEHVKENVMHRSIVRAMDAQSLQQSRRIPVQSKPVWTTIKQHVNTNARGRNSQSAY
jgi:hypothetical protein